MADRNLREAEFGGDLCQAPFVRGVAIAMHQYDRDAVDAVRARLLQRGARGVFVERDQQLAVGTDALGNFGNLGVRRRRAVEPAREQVGTILIADGQRIAEAARDREQGRRALAFEQRVGRNGRSHAHRERRQRACPGAGQVADRTHRRVAGTRRVFGKIFGSDDRPRRRARDDVGEGAAAIDPDMPARIRRRRHDRASG